MFLHNSDYKSSNHLRKALSARANRPQLAISEDKRKITSAIRSLESQTKKRVPESAR